MLNTCTSIPLSICLACLLYLLFTVKLRTTRQNNMKIWRKKCILRREQSQHPAYTLQQIKLYKVDIFFSILFLSFTSHHSMMWSSYNPFFSVYPCFRIRNFSSKSRVSYVYKINDKIGKIKFSLEFTIA